MALVRLSRRTRLLLLGLTLCCDARVVHAQASTLSCNGPSEEAGLVGNGTRATPGGR